MLYLISKFQVGFISGENLGRNSFCGRRNSFCGRRNFVCGRYTILKWKKEGFILAFIKISSH
jgi:hypothetical protein